LASPFRGSGHMDVHDSVIARRQEKKRGERGEDSQAVRKSREATSRHNPTYNEHVRFFPHNGEKRRKRKERKKRKK